MELRALLLLLLCFPGFQAQISSTEETRSEGSSLYIQCPYTTQTTHQQQKVWCRLRNRQCEPLVETKEYTHTSWAAKGRVALKDNPTERTVSVTMTELQAEDSGTYFCAYYSSGYYPLRMISLFVFKELHKWELDSVSVQCPPSTMSYSVGTKVWCRREDETLCSVMARTDYPSTQLNSKALKDRTSIQDDTQKRTVTITMQKLQAEDSGMYWCALYRRSHFTWLMEVRLSVLKSEYLLAARRGCLQISAPSPALPPQLTAFALSLWQTHWQLPLHAVYSQQRLRGGSQELPLFTRASHRQIQPLQKQLLQLSTGLAHGGHCWRPVPLPGIALDLPPQLPSLLSNVSVQCPYSDPEYRTVSKAWCKEGARNSCTVLVTTTNLEYQRTPQQGRVRIQDDTEQGIVTVTMERLQVQDAGVYWCALYEDAHLFRMLEVTLNVSEVLAGTTLPGATGTSQTTPPANSPAPSLWAIPQPSPRLWKQRQCPGISWTSLLLKSLILAHSKENREEEDTYEKPGDTAQPDSHERLESPRDNSKDLKYVTLNFKSRLSPEDPLYCNVELSEAQRKPKDENVEYAIIAFKQLSTNDKG
uniref:Uncharacterized protein n=1 Tax=Melopsittacus undulatus TaxID=13146 RepID=A0A8V5HD32_MELUD